MQPKTGCANTKILIATAESGKDKLKLISDKQTTEARVLYSCLIVEFDFCPFQIRYCLHSVGN